MHITTLSLISYFPNNWAEILNILVLKMEASGTVCVWFAEKSASHLDSMAKINMCDVLEDLCSRIP